MSFRFTESRPVLQCPLYREFAHPPALMSVIPSLPQRPHVVVIGGGISGLAAAFRLTRIAPGLAVTVVEREPRLGGMIRTERIDGCLIEGGPDSFLAAKPRGVGLCEELGIAGRLQGPNPALRRTYVMRE